MRIINFRKFIRNISIIFGIIIVLSLFIVKSSLSHVNITYKSIYVESGDTLWSIASNLQSEDYYKNKDVRYIIQDLKSINNLKSSNLSINQELKIPTV